MATGDFGMHDRRVLTDCAMGRVPADLVLRNGRLVSVQTREILEHMDVAIVDGRIAYVGEDAAYTIGRETRVIDVQGKFLVPGLLDAHMHVESGMVTVTEFVRIVLPHGTTGMFVDPHEIANVFGLRGVRLMVDEAAQMPSHVFVQMPSCVPSAPGLETPGAIVGPAEVAEAMTWPGIIGLGEVMNFPGVFNGDDKLHAEMAVVRGAGKVIGGHYASPDLGMPFHGYVAGGAQDDHEGTRLEDALARARQGMSVMMRYGSAWHDVAAQAPALTEQGLDSRNFLLCTDDCQAATLVNEGHMDRVVRHAIAQGIPPLVAIQMATINTAEHFGVSQEIGLIAPGRYADILIVSDLADLHAETVICKGEIAAENGELKIALPVITYPQWALHSVHLPDAVTPADFRLVPAQISPAETMTAHVIGVIENHTPTRHLEFPVTLQDGQVQADMSRDLAKIAVVERHHGTGRVQVGLVNGFGFNVPCAVATTVAHDSHQMIVVGTDDADMAKAVNRLADVGGGQVVFRQGEELGLVELPIAGLMSNERAEVVAAKAGGVLDAFRSCGCGLNNPNMQLSLLALVVIPELRISDLGLVDVNRFDFIPVLE